MTLDDLISFVSTVAMGSYTIENPTWEDAERAIRSLDANTTTEVMLAPAPPKGPPEGDHHMGIGGGKEDAYIVYATEDNLNFWNLEDPAQDRAGKCVRMTIGGQEGDYPAAQCVPLDWALKAARDYFERGGLATDLTWMRG